MVVCADFSSVASVCSRNKNCNRQFLCDGKKHAVLHSHIHRAGSDASFHADSASSVRWSDYNLVEHSFGTHFRRNPSDDIDKDSA